MIGGVNFQPGQSNGLQQQRPKDGNSTQEAIKILSLRLPKQVGPNALAPAALLNAQGSGGNPRIDSVVNAVMNRIFPTGGGPSSGAPVLGPSEGENSTMPVSPPVRFDGNARPAGNTSLSSMMAPVRAASTTPNVTFENKTPIINDEFKPAPPGPPPGFDGNIPRYDGPLMGAPEPTQDPWADLMNYIKRKNETPMGPESMP